MTINNNTVNYEEISTLSFTKPLTDRDLLLDNGFIKKGTYYINPKNEKSMDLVCKIYGVIKGDVDFIGVNEKSATTKTQVTGAYTRYLNNIRKAKIDIGLLSEIDMDYKIYPDVTRASIYEACEKGSNEDKTTAIWQPIFSEIFTRAKGYSTTFESRSGKGIVDGHIKFLERFNSNDKPVWTTIAHIEMKSPEGDGWQSLMAQNNEYANHNNTSNIEGSYLICIRGDEIAFFTFKEDFHNNMGFGLKDERYDGLLGLYIDESQINMVPQYNNHKPQLYIYKLGRSQEDNNSITAILLHMSCTTMSLQPATYDYDQNFTNKVCSPSDKNLELVSEPNPKFRKALLGNLSDHTNDFRRAFIDHRGKITYELDKLHDKGLGIAKRFSEMGEC